MSVFFEFYFTSEQEMLTNVTLFKFVIKKWKRRKVKVLNRYHIKKAEQYISRHTALKTTKTKKKYNIKNITRNIQLGIEHFSQTSLLLRFVFFLNSSVSQERTGTLPLSYFQSALFLLCFSVHYAPVNQPFSPSNILAMYPTLFHLSCFIASMMSLVLIFSSLLSSFYHWVLSLNLPPCFAPKRHSIHYTLKRE